MPTLTLENMSFGYGRGDIFSSVSVETSNALLCTGANGSGKTTLLKLLARVLWPRAGTIRLDGRRRYVSAAFFGDEILLDDLTVFAHFNWLKRHVDADDAFQHRARELFDLHAMWGARVGDLSCGMRRWVGLAFSLSTPSEAYFLDEPFAHLDETRMRLLIAALGEVCALGRFVALTHHVPVSLGFAHKVWNLCDG
ncbi:MAG: ABC transporter ATP-binding protein [Proteobacteria bacterium]|nr:ABC transporter ATP-binding protein [Pseudomonadota bacterium]